MLEYASIHRSFPHVHLVFSCSEVVHVHAGVPEHAFRVVPLVICKLFEFSCALVYLYVAHDRWQIHVDAQCLSMHVASYSCSEMHMVYSQYWSCMVVSIIWREDQPSEPSCSTCTL